MSSHWIIKANRGFTLVELLTSMAIISIVMLLLLWLMDQSSSTYRNSQSAVSNLSEARAFFQFFEADVSSKLPGTSLMLENGVHSDKVAFVRSQSYDEQISPSDGDLRTSAYYVAFTQDAGTSVSPKLFRKSLDDRQTQILIESSANPPIPPTEPWIDEPIVYNVIRYKTAAKIYDAAGTLQPWTPTSSGPPAVLEVTLETTDDFTASRYQTEASWGELRNPSNKQVNEAVRTYTRSIILSQ
jgi:prepilin-type N-terminal cleavage/methylation domain-containing protein